MIHQFRHEIGRVYRGQRRQTGEKFELDIEYADRISFLKDMITIIFITISKVVKRKGIHSENKQTVEFFTGSGLKLNLTARSL